jgi:hypothetical protein
MTDARVNDSSWRDALIVLLAAEGLAVAVWLLPASIHIVQWPASGPTRLALLNPTWQLLALCTGALVLSTAARVAVSRFSRVSFSKVARAAASFLLLWLWAVPYLPWLPDQLPLLLVLAGPLRWVIAGIALALSLHAALGVGDRAAAVLQISRRTVFVTSLVIYLAFGLYSVRSIAPVGDEPHYLIIVESLLRDGDLKIENNHQRRDYLSFFFGNLHPDFFERGKDGEIYSIHAPGVPALVLPVYAIGGRTAAVLFVVLMAALAALAVFDLGDAIAGRAAAVITWAACCFGVPFVPYAWLIFPEIPATLVVAWAALWLWQPTNRPVATWVWRGVILGVLPWLHTKFVVFQAMFGAPLAIRLLRQPRLLAAFLAPMAVSGLLWFYFFYAIYGTLDPTKPYGAYANLYVRNAHIPHGLIGIFFDQKFGLLFYSPIYLAAAAGAWLMLRRRDTRFLGAFLIVVVGSFVASTARLYMFWGGSSAPARFLVPIVPCLAPFVAMAIQHATGVWSRALVGAWVGIGLCLGIVALAWPDRLFLFSDPHGRSRLLEALQGGSPLALVVPTFTEPEWMLQVRPFFSLAGMALAVLAVMWIASKFSWATPRRIAGIGAAVLLLGAASVTARPDRSVRDATARRGELDVLARFDGDRFRTLDYGTLGRVTPDRFRELTTMSLEPRASEIAETGYTAGPFTVPPGVYDVTVHFAGMAARAGEVILSTPPPHTTFAKLSGTLQNPSRLRLELPVTVRRLMLRVPDRSVASAIRRIEISPQSIVPPREREQFFVRTIESAANREGAYIVYADEHAYPENGIFWSRGTARTSIFLAPAGATRLTLTLSTGPMSGDVEISVGGRMTNVAMTAGQIQVLSFDLPSGQRLVPLTVQSDVMFRPGEIDAASDDMRGLGCQVRIGLE